MKTQLDLSCELKEKLFNVKKIIKNQKKACIAFSGGVDSTLLLKLSLDLLGEKVLPITIKGAMMPESEYQDVIKLSEQMGINPLIIETDIFSLEEFSANQTDRCYHCKKYIFKQIQKAAINHQCSVILDGSNFDDQFDYRPGLKALAELGILSPFKEARLTKKDIRKLSYYYGLKTATKPAMACLATRIPTNTKITATALSMIEKGEEVLKALKLSQYRLRLIGDVAKIECLPLDFEIILKERPQIINALKQLGFKAIVLDLDGYQQGSMNVEKI